MKAFVLLCAVAVVGALPMTKEDGVAERFISALKDCMDTDTSLCLKEKAMRFTDKLAASSNLEILDGIALKNTGSARSARSYEPLPEEPKARELKVEERIMENVVDFLDSHVVQFRIPKALEDDNAVEEEGRGKKKKKLKKLLPLLALIKLKLAALIPLFLGIIAFAVFKAYLLGKIAFIAAAFGALKKLLEAKKSSGWSEPPHEEHHGWENSGGWGRSQDAQEMAYGAHAKEA